MKLNAWKPLLGPVCDPTFKQPVDAQPFLCKFCSSRFRSFSSRSLRIEQRIQILKVYHILFKARFTNRFDYKALYFLWQNEEVTLFIVAGNHEYYTGDVENWFKFLKQMGRLLLLHR